MTESIDVIGYASPRLPPLLTSSPHKATCQRLGSGRRTCDPCGRVRPTWLDAKDDGMAIPILSRRLARTWSWL
jgi:hypothetical protein